MAYTCSYCKTGVMNTGEMYLNHINGTKHKKKVFLLQAPDDGIEYNEFKKNRPPKVETGYVEKKEDFPSLSENTNNHVNGLNALPYTVIKEKLSMNKTPIVVYNDSVIEIESSDDGEFVSIDDVFYKENSKIESARYIVSSYIRNQKTAAQALNEIAKAMLWDIDFQPVAALNYRFGIAVYIDGIEFTIGEGENKKEAKQNAAAEAINEIKMKLKRNRHATKAPIASTIGKKIDITPVSDFMADCYRKIVQDKMKDIESYTDSIFTMPQRYAGFIITERYDQQAQEGTIVAFAAGQGMLDRLDTCQSQPGYCLKNFDALVLARRSLQCFFYNQILLIFDKKKQKFKGEKIYFEIAKNGFVKLKYGCRLHLFTSHAPSGDCVESIPEDWQEPVKLSQKEVDRDRNGNMEPIMYTSYYQTVPLNDPGHIRIKDSPSRKEWTSLVTYRMTNEYNRDLVMSTSDKLMTWIHLGIQGAMLSHLMNPIYLYSIQFGRNYMHEHISRALLCRVPLENIISNRGTYYDAVKFFDPYFERVSEIQHSFSDSLSANGNGSSNSICLNWYMNPISEIAEFIDTKTGCVHPNSPFKLPGGEEYSKCSRLSKVCMLMRFKESISVAIDYFAMRPEFQRTRFLQGINQAAKYNYNSFKSSATDYRRLKQCLFESLYDANYGQWLPNVAASEFNLLDFYDV